MGMGYIDVKERGKNGALSVQAKPSLWIYLALTVPLTVGTLAGWWGWEWWSRREREGGLQGKGKRAVVV